MSADIPASPPSLARRIQDAVAELNRACSAAASADLTVKLDVVTEARIGSRPDCPIVIATVTRVERGVAVAGTEAVCACCGTIVGTFRPAEDGETLFVSTEPTP